MFPNITSARSSLPAKQKGSMLVIAIVVMTVILLLGLAMTRVLASSSNAVVYEVLGFRALNAARAGMEFNLSRALNSDQELSTICNLGVGAVPLTVSSGDIFPAFSSNIPGVENCRFDASCRMQPAGNSGDDYFRFTSRGTCEAGDVAVSRVVAVDARL